MFGDLALLVEEWNLFVYFESTYQTEMLPEMSRTKPAQGQKITSFELQSAPNLHKDKKKQKFWTSKCTKPAQGQKKQKKTKTLEGYLPLSK